MTWNTEEISKLLIEAGALAQRLKKDMKRELKHDRSLVTQADREIEALLASELESPAEGRFLIGEETVAQKGEAYLQKALSAECFVVDPIDGTAPYAYGLPVWGVSLGRMEGGVLTDGAVFLPDMEEFVMSDGDEVLQGSRRGSRWEWTALEVPAPVPDGHGLIAVTQAVAKRGKVLLPNPVLVLGAAVVPMVGLMQGRFIAYLGSLRLWDLAGAFPLLLRKGFAASVQVGEETRRVTARVEPRTYHLDSGSRLRWALRSDLLICRQGEEAHFRGAFFSTA